LRLVNSRLSGFLSRCFRRRRGRGGGLASNARRRASETLSGTRKWLVFGLGLDVLFFVLFEFHINLLTRLNIHDRERSTALADAIENLCIPRIVRSEQFTVVN
jgi:hypothetical protein